MRARLGRACWHGRFQAPFISLLIDAEGCRQNAISTLCSPIEAGALIDFADSYVYATPVIEDGLMPMIWRARRMRAMPPLAAAR